MIGLLFRCYTVPDLPEAAVEALQRDIWKKCHARGMGGFLVNAGGHLLGLFEGEDRAVLAVIETMIRKSQISSVVVLREVALSEPSKAFWTSMAYHVDDLRGAPQVFDPDLAKLLPFPVEPRGNKDLPTEL